MEYGAIQRRLLPEHIFQTVCFEGIAIAILAPTTSWLMQRSVIEMSGQTILLATTAMIWNIIYIMFRSSVAGAPGETRTAKVRTFHAL